MSCVLAWAAAKTWTNPGSWLLLECESECERACSCGLHSLEGLGFLARFCGEGEIVVWEGDEGVEAIGSTERRTCRVSRQILAFRSYEEYHNASSSVE